MLARRLHEVAGLAPAFQRQANAVFLHMPEALVSQLHARGWHFYKFLEPDVYRVMCSWAMTEQVIEEFIADVEAVQQ
jgi:threonine aldolase